MHSYIYHICRWVRPHECRTKTCFEEMCICRLEQPFTVAQDKNVLNAVIIMPPDEMMTHGTMESAVIMLN